jgi:putative NADH-flavin reductase
MNIFIFGITGRVGKTLAQYAKNDGHKVFGLVRNLPSENFPADKLIQGDVLNYVDVNKAIEGADVIVSCLGVKIHAETITLLSEGVKNMALAMYNWDISRIITVAGSGILQESETKVRKDNPDFPVNFQNITNDHWRAFEILKSTSHNFTVVCPPYMPNAEKTGRYRTLADYHPENGLKISVEDVADFILKEVESPRYMRKRVGIAY